jgi:hypothetical protein
MKQHYLGKEFKHAGNYPTGLNLLAEWLHDRGFGANDKLLKDQIGQDGQLLHQQFVGMLQVEFLVSNVKN